MKKSPRGQAVANFLKFLNKSEADRAMPKQEPKPEAPNELDESAIEALKALAEG